MCVFANFNAGVHVADFDHMHSPNPIGALESHIYMGMLSVGVFFWQTDFLHMSICFYVLRFLLIYFVRFDNIY